MIEGFTYLDRIRSKEEFDELAKLAKDDRHGLYMPTHVVRKNGTMVGYLSIGNPGAVIVFGWFSTKEMSSRESFHLVNTAEGIVTGPKGNVICFPIPKDSPFHSNMESMGYKNAGEYTFFIKEL